MKRVKRVVSAGSRDPGFEMPEHSPVGETLRSYLRPVVVVSLEESAATAARRIRDQRVGCVVVVRGDRPIGVLTDRDLAIRVVAEGRDPSTTRVDQILTYDPLTLCDTDTTDSAARLMREHGIRRLPIVDAQGTLRGIVTADDLVVQLSRCLASLGAALAEPSDTEDSR